LNLTYPFDFNFRQKSFLYRGKTEILKSKMVFGFVSLREPHEQSQLTGLPLSFGVLSYYSYARVVDRGKVTF
jgi:hypothetical protein